MVQYTEELYKLIRFLGDRRQYFEVFSQRVEKNKCSIAIKIIRSDSKNVSTET